MRGIQVLEAFDARQQEFDAVFLMGLNERAFPRVVGDNPFLRDDERQALAGHGVELVRQVELADEERILFYRVLTAPSRQLVLSFARTGGDGRPALPSYYLEEVREVFAGDGPPTVARTLADVVPHAEEAVGIRERALCASAAIAGHRPLDDARLQPLLAELAAAKPHLFADLPRFLDARPGHDLRSPGLRARVRRAASGRAFSASELETFLACPHQHFLAHQLRLREVREEVGPAEVGTLLHAALRRFFNDCRGMPALPDDSEQRMEAILDDCLERTIRDPRPWRVQMIRHVAREYLLRFLERERAYREQTGLVPTWFELAFGPQSSYRQAEQDPASHSEPLVVQGPEGEVTLAGTIDRVDLTPDGSAAVVMDYKLSGGPNLKEMMEGASLQMPIYLLAMERLFGKPAAAGIYQPLRRGDPHWLFRPGVAPSLRPGKGDGLAGPKYTQLMEVAQASILAAAGGIRGGESRPSADEKVCRYCAFHDICRPDESGDAHA